jgi:hypothetical protein
MPTFSRVITAGVLVLASWACSSSSGNGTTPGKDGGGGGDDSGGTCTIPGKFCFTIVADEDCAGQGGTVGTGTCAVGMGCCETATQTTCYYDLEDDIGGSIACQGTYVAGDSGTGDDGGAVDASAGDTGTSGGASAFVGSWSGTIATVETCGSSSPTTANNPATLDIALGSASDSLVVTTLNGCMWNYTVNGDGALAQSGQVCNVMGSDGGITSVITVMQRSLTLSGSQLTETGSIGIVKEGVSCTESEMGVLTE